MVKRKLSVTQRKQKIFQKLQQHAQQGQTESYHELMLKEFPSRRWHGHYLGEFCAKCIELNIPLLPVLAVTKQSKMVDGSGLPSYGFFEFPPVIKKMQESGISNKIVWAKTEQQKCYEYFKNNIHLQ